MWVYRNLCTCFALPRDESYFERLRLMDELHPLTFIVLGEIGVTEWTTETQVRRNIQEFGPQLKGVSERQISEALLALVADGKVKRRFIPREVDDTDESAEVAEQVDQCWEARIAE